MELNDEESELDASMPDRVRNARRPSSINDDAWCTASAARQRPLSISSERRAPPSDA
jgi:hypothetical protein